MWRGLTSWVWVRIFKDFPSSLKVWEDQLYICVGEKTCYLQMDTLEIFQYISVLLTFVVIFLILTLFIKRKHFICCTYSVRSLSETEREPPASLQGVTWISISEPTDLPTYEELKLNGDLSSPPPSYWSLYPFRIYYDQPVVMQTVWVRVQVSIISILNSWGRHNFTLYYDVKCVPLCISPKKQSFYLPIIKIPSFTSYLLFANVVFDTIYERF